MNVLLGVTGSVAATLTDKTVAALEANGHEVKVVITRPATYFWRKGCWAYLLSIFFSKLCPRRLRSNPFSRKIMTDFDEWPGTRYHKGANDLILHIALRDWADVLVIAPLTANTLAKLAHGICDNLLTSVFRAWCLGARAKPIILAPAMNTKMWEHPCTQAHLDKLEFGTTIVPPQSKQLACGEIGIGAMAKIEDIVAKVDATARKVRRAPVARGRRTKR